MLTSGTVYIARGGEESLAQIEALLIKSGMSMHGADAYVRTYTHFGVDDARAIVAKAQLSAFGEQRVFVLVVSGITVEAQNALLKTFEEAPGNAVFILIVPSPGVLLPTLRSRAQTLELVHAGESMIDGGVFCKASMDERIDLLKPLLEKGEEDRRDTGAILAFFSELERTLAPRISEPSVRDALKTIYTLRGFVGDKGALIKTLLETVAATVPRM